VDKDFISFEELISFKPETAKSMNQKGDQPASWKNHLPKVRLFAFAHRAKGIVAPKLFYRLKVLA
jgi:hypothetical protein